MQEATISDKAIEHALGVIRSRLGHAERERAELEKRIAADREEERLLRRLLALRRGDSADALKDEPTGFEGRATASESETEDATRRPAQHGINLRDDDKVIEQGTERDVHSAVGAPAVRAVIEELVAAGRPLHISELMRLLGEKKISIPGAGAQANLITHLRRDRRFIRPSRGMYGLAQWGLEEMPARRRRRRRKRVKARGHGTRKDA